jgi:hypothetical protein
VEYQDRFKDRFSGLDSLFRSHRLQELLGGGILKRFVSMPEPNSNDYLPLRRYLEERCEAFIAKAENGELKNPGIGGERIYTHLSESYARHFHRNRVSYEHWYDRSFAAKQRDELREAWGLVQKYEEDQAEKNSSLNEAWGLVKKYEEDQAEKNRSLNEAWGLIKKYEEDQAEKNAAINALKEETDEQKSKITRMEKRHEALSGELERIKTSPFWWIYQKTLKQG